MSPARPRIAALDLARALGVVAMVVGHTLDALLAPAVREAPLAVAYWKARGLTAPIFLVASGWAATVAIRRGGAAGGAAIAGRFPRALLLFTLGLALRYPGWGADLLLRGDRATWGHLLAFDVLQTIAVSLLLLAAVLALPVTRREQRGVVVLLAVLAIALGMAPPAPFPVDPASLPGGPLLALAQALGGTSPFPLLPWAAYFLAGAFLGLSPAPAGPPRAGLAAAGAALVAATCWTGVGTMPPGHPALVVFRIGAVLLLLAALSAAPGALAARVAPLGRASLAVYVLHVPVVYGWSTHAGLAQRLGPTLGAGAALAVAALVLAGSVAAALAGGALLRARRAPAPGRARDAEAPRATA